MEREIHLHPDAMRHVTRICFILPRNGNDTEYMAVDSNDIGFDGLILNGEGVARAILKKEHKDNEAKQMEKDYQEFLRLKKIFEP